MVQIEHVSVFIYSFLQDEFEKIKKVIFSKMSLCLENSFLNHIKNFNSHDDCDMENYIEPNKQDIPMPMIKPMPMISPNTLGLNLEYSFLQNLARGNFNTTTHHLASHTKTVTRYIKQPKYCIKKLKFSILSPELIEKWSVCEVFDSTKYQKGIPKPNAINDPRMGTVDRRIPCSTCRKNINGCNGHIGHIKLTVPLYNVCFLPFVVKVLNCICYFCSKIRLADDAPEWQDILKFSSYMQFEELTKICKGFSKKANKCWHCGGPYPLFVQNKLEIVKKWDEGIIFDNSHVKNIDEKAKSERVEDLEIKEHAHRPLIPRIVRDILYCISDEDAIKMGLGPDNRPEWMITTVLLVPPPQIRPAIMASDSSRSRGQDDLTRKLQDILKCNKQLKTLMESGSYDIKKKTLESLQQHYAVYLNNDGKITQADVQRSGNKTRAITQRLAGKNGLIRNKIMGKRVNHSSRTVISGDPTLDLEELRVPLQIAMTLTFPEKVTLGNLEEMRKRVLNGPHHILGAQELEYPDGNKKNLNICNFRETLKVFPGCIVHRHLKNGDYVIFNRQPSLHKQSIMGHRVRLVMPWKTKDIKTFGVNPGITTPYNADFDGDEMNMHVPQSEKAQNEVRDLMAVPKHLLGAQNRSVVGLIQDAMLSAYLLTRKDVFLNREDMMNYAMQVRYWTGQTKPFELPLPAILKPQPLWTGKQLFSWVLPPVQFLKKTRGIDKDIINDAAERIVEIQNGELIRGALCKNSMGSGEGGILHTISLDFGTQLTHNFYSDLHRILVAYITNRGFSVGISDCIIDPQVQQNVHTMIDHTFNKVESITQKMEQLPHLSEQEIEGPKFSLLSSVLGKASSMVQKTLDDKNRLNCMVLAGSKGSAVNIGQITSTVGQQVIEGKRILPEQGNRTLNCFAPHDFSPPNCGFVINSYISGLTMKEYFFHAMGGREGLVDTVVKTSKSGYIQRKLTKGMENLKVWDDYSVRDAQGNIVSFCYGGNGIDAKYLEKSQKLVFLTWSPQQLKEYCQPTHKVAQLEYQNLLELQDQTRRAKITWAYPELDTNIYIPLCLPRILNQMTQFGEEELEPLTIWQDVQELLQSISDLFLKTYICFHLCSHNILHQWHLTYEQWQELTSIISNKLEHSRIQPGEMVGALAAECIGEQNTQMTLNSCIWSDSLVIFNGQMSHVICIGQLIDDLLIQHATNIQWLPQNRTQYLKLEQPLWVPSVDQHGQSSWQKVTAVTRHVPVGNLVHITTKSGRSCTVTASKSVLCWDGSTFIPTRGDEIKVGDFMPTVFKRVGNKKNTFKSFNHPQFKFPLDILNTFPLTIHQQFPFYTFDTGKKNISTFEEAAVWCELYSLYGIFTSIEKSGPYWQVSIINDFIQINNCALDEIVNIEYIENAKHPWVYDLTVENTLNFCLVGGLGLRDTFHLSGVGNQHVTMGVPRLSELLDVTKDIKTPSMNIYLKPQVYQDDHFKVMELAKSLEKCYLEDVIESIEILRDPDLQFTVIAEDAELVEMSNIFYPEEEDYSEYIIRIVLDQLILISRNLTVTDVIRACQEFLSPHIWIDGSADNMDKWVIRLRIDSFIQTVIQPLEPSQKSMVERTILQTFQNYLLKRIIIGGLNFIEKATCRQINYSTLKEEKMVSQKEWIIDTYGSNLSGIWLHPVVDWQRTISNDIQEVYRVLGIGATKQVLFNEIKKVLTSGGSYVNDHHILMVVQNITQHGNLTPFTRFGICKFDKSPLAKSSFEKAMDNLIQAAVQGTEDPIEGVSERIMVGRRTNIGPQCFDSNTELQTIEEEPNIDSIVCTQLTCAFMPWEIMEKNFFNPFNLNTPPLVSELANYSGQITHTSDIELLPTSPFNQLIFNYRPTSPNFEVQVHSYKPSSPTFIEF